MKTEKRNIIRLNLQHFAEDGAGAPKGAGDGVKGLHVYGSKNTMPNAIAKLVGTFA